MVVTLEGLYILTFNGVTNMFYKLVYSKNYNICWLRFNRIFPFFSHGYKPRGYKPRTRVA